MWRTRVGPVYATLPSTVRTYVEYAKRASGKANRCQVVGGDFFNGVPGGADAYLLKSVLHDWDDEQATRILKTCRAAMPGAKLLVVEPVIRVNEPDPANLFTDLRRLVMNGGRERTVADFQELFAAAGFRLSKITSTQSPGSIIEGVPI